MTDKLNREELLELAKQAGFNAEPFIVPLHLLERFAALLSARQEQAEDEDAAWRTECHLYDPGGGIGAKAKEERFRRGYRAALARPSQPQEPIAAEIDESLKDLIRSGTGIVRVSRVDPAEFRKEPIKASVADEREVFEKWVATREGHPFAGKFLNLMWDAWQARAALSIAQPATESKRNTWITAIEKVANQLDQYWPTDSECIESLRGISQFLSQQPAALEDNEQYRLQMAAISTAAIGYWKEGDGIHPDYDTLALRDVAKLYVKYDELFKARPAAQTVVLDAKDKQIAQLQAALKNANSDADMYANAWQRELCAYDGKIINKRHHIDAMVLTTQDLVARLRKAETALSAAPQPVAAQVGDDLNALYREYYDVDQAYRVLHDQISPGLTTPTEQHYKALADLSKRFCKVRDALAAHPQAAQAKGGEDV